MSKIDIYTGRLPNYGGRELQERFEYGNELWAVVGYIPKHGIATGKELDANGDIVDFYGQLSFFDLYLWMDDEMNER